MRRFTLWLTVTVSAGMFLGMSVVLLLPQYTPSSGRGELDWSEAFGSCAVPLSSDQALALAQECVQSEILAAIDAGSVDSMFAGLDRADRDIPGFHVTCHAAGHEAGRLAFENTRDAPRLLKYLDSTACAYAVGHGVLDGFALGVPSLGDFVDVVRACESFASSRGSLFTACADGTGHAAWTTTKSFPEAFDLCGHFTAPTAQSLCAEGLLCRFTSLSQ